MAELERAVEEDEEDERCSFDAQVWRQQQAMRAWAHIAANIPNSTSGDLVRNRAWSCFAFPVSSPAVA